MSRIFAFAAGDAADGHHYQAREDILIETVRSLQPDQEQDPRAGLQEPETESLLQMARRMKLSERVRFALRCGKEGGPCSFATATGPSSWP